MAKSVVITGASSGIGRGLALKFAEQGATLGLIGRDQQRLDEVAEACRKLGAKVEIGRIDVREREQLAHWLEQFDTAQPIDLLIANAGVTGGIAPNAAAEDPQASGLMLEINTLGAFNTVNPLIPRMIARRNGQIAMVSSIAAFVPLPDTPSYSASKAAVLQYGRALRAALRKHNVKVNVVCPGYVDTPMTKKTTGWKPLEISVDAAVDKILRGLERDQAVIAFPAALAAVARFGAMLPDGLRRQAVKYFAFKVTRG